MLNRQGQQKLVDSLNSTLYIHVAVQNMKVILVCFSHIVLQTRE